MGPSLIHYAILHKAESYVVLKKNEEALFEQEKLLRYIVEF